MKLGAVLMHERERIGMSPEDTASQMRLSAEDYQVLESGASPAEEWGPVLARIATALQTPTSRLLSPTGKSADAVPGQVGALIRGHRVRRGISPDEIAAESGLTTESYFAIEAGGSALEDVGPTLLRFAEVVGQPVFNLVYPCGLPLSEITEYVVE